MLTIAKLPRWSVAYYAVSRFKKRLITACLGIWFQSEPAS